MFEPNEEQITGTWRSDPDDLEAIRMYGDVSLDFLPDGQLTYTVHSEGKRQIMLLTYRIEGDMLTTDQPSEPKEGDAHIKRKAAGLVSEGEEALHGGEGAILGGGTSLPQGLHPRLQVRQGNRSQGLVDEFEEAGGLKTVGPPRMGTRLQRQPKGDQRPVGACSEPRMTNRDQRTHALQYTI